MRPIFLRPRPSSKGLVFDLALTGGFLTGGFAANATVQEKTNTYTCTAVGTVDDIPIPVYPGFDFTGATSHFIDIGTGPTSVKTISFWVKLDDVTGNEYPIDLNGTDYITILSGVVTVTGLAGHSLYVNGVLGTSGVTTITAAKWYLIVVTDATANDASDLDINRVGPFYSDSVMSEIRLYNRVLSVIEVLDIYNLQKWRYGI